MSRSFKQRALISSMILTTSIVGLVILAGSRISVADIMYTKFYNYCDVDRSIPPSAQCDFDASVTDDCLWETEEGGTYYCDNYKVPQSCTPDDYWVCFGNFSGCGTKRDCATGQIVYDMNGPVVCDNNVTTCTRELMD